MNVPDSDDNPTQSAPAILDSLREREYALLVDRAEQIAAPAVTDTPHDAVHAVLAAAAAHPHDLPDAVRAAVDHLAQAIQEQPQAAEHQPVSAADPTRHLTHLQEYHQDDPTPHPVTLAAATTEIRQALDEPQADPTWALRRTLTIQTLREFATRLLIARRRGQLDTDDSYPRAISDLAVALSLQRDDTDPWADGVSIS